MGICIGICVPRPKAVLLFTTAKREKQHMCLLLREKDKIYLQWNTVLLKRRKFL